MRERIRDDAVLVGGERGRKPAEDFSCIPIKRGEPIEYPAKKHNAKYLLSFVFSRCDTNKARRDIYIQHLSIYIYIYIHIYIYIYI